MNSALPPDVIDLSVLTSCVADKDGQVEILRSFQSENLHDIAALRAALAKDDADAAAKTAHRMKGVSRMVGAAEMQAICYQIETAAKQHDLVSAQESQGRLADAMQRLDAYIAQHNSD